MLIINPGTKRSNDQGDLVLLNMSFVFKESLKRVTWHSSCIQYMFCWLLILRGQRKQGRELNIYFVYLRSLWKGWHGTHCVFDFEGPTKTMRGNQYMFCVFESLRQVHLVLLGYLRSQWWGGGGGGEEEGHSGPWPSFRWSCPCWELWSQKIEKSSCKNSTYTLAGVGNEIRYSVKKFKLYKMLLLLGFLSVEPNYIHTMKGFKTFEKAVAT